MILNYKRLLSVLARTNRQSVRKACALQAWPETSAKTWGVTIVVQASRERIQKRLDMHAHSGGMAWDIQNDFGGEILKSRSSESLGEDLSPPRAGSVPTANVPTPNVPTPNVKNSASRHSPHVLEDLEEDQDDGLEEDSAAADDAPPTSPPPCKPQSWSDVVRQSDLRSLHQKLLSPDRCSPLYFFSFLTGVILSVFSLS